MTEVCNTQRFPAVFWEESRLRNGKFGNKFPNIELMCAKAHKEV